MAGVTVGFCRGRGVFSHLIGWFGAGYYSHVTTLLPDQRTVIDARLRGGVARRPASYLASETVDWFRLECSGAQALAVYGFLTAQLGKQYDVEGIINFATGATKDNNWRRRSAWFCDELAAASWIAAGIAKPTLPREPLNRLTPGGSALILSQLNFTRVKVTL